MRTAAPFTALTHAGYRTSKGPGVTKSWPFGHRTVTRKRQVIEFIGAYRMFESLPLRQKSKWGPTGPILIFSRVGCGRGPCSTGAAAEQPARSRSDHPVLSAIEMSMPYVREPCSTGTAAKQQARSRSDYPVLSAKVILLPYVRGPCSTKSRGDFGRRRRPKGEPALAGESIPPSPPKKS